MTDIRLNQPKSTQIWTTVSVLAVVALILWGAATIFGDRTAAEERPGVGATAGFGDHRAPVLPAQAAPFGSVSPPGPRDLGRLVQLVGRGESRVRVHSLWVRTPENYRILVRFDPEPPPELLAGIGPGSAVSFHGYVTAIGVAEFKGILDSLGVSIPRPPPGRKFGDLPDPGFAVVDSLFIKAYYISVRPEGIRPEVDRAAVDPPGAVPSSRNSLGANSNGTNSTAVNSTPANSSRADLSGMNPSETGPAGTGSSSVSTSSVSTSAASGAGTDPSGGSTSGSNLSGTEAAGATLPGVEAGTGQSGTDQSGVVRSGPGSAPDLTPTAPEAIGTTNP